MGQVRLKQGAVSWQWQERSGTGQGYQIAQEGKKAGRQQSVQVSKISIQGRERRMVFS